MFSIKVQKKKSIFAWDIKMEELYWKTSEEMHLNWRIIVIYGVEKSENGNFLVWVP